MGAGNRDQHHACQQRDEHPTGYSHLTHPITTVSAQYTPCSIAAEAKLFIALPHQLQRRFMPQPAQSGEGALGHKLARDDALQCDVQLARGFHYLQQNDGDLAFVDSCLSHVAV